MTISIKHLIITIILLFLTLILTFGVQDCDGDWLTSKRIEHAISN